MSGVKNNPEIKVYYTDTDSIITNKPLKNSLVGNLLGQFKLECVIDKAVFLAPKVYGLITESGEQIIKIKGLTKDAVKDISFNELLNLLKRDRNIQLDQEKWLKDKTILNKVSNFI